MGLSRGTLDVYFDSAGIIRNQSLIVSLVLALSNEFSMLPKVVLSVVVFSHNTNGFSGLPPSGFEKALKNRKEILQLQHPMWTGTSDLWQKLAIFRSQCPNPY